VNEVEICDSFKKDVKFHVKDTEDQFLKAQISIAFENGAE